MLIKMSSLSSDSTVFEIPDSDVVVVNDERSTSHDDGRGANGRPEPDISDGENETTVWCKGDQCMAYYSGEDMYYEAHIIQLIRKNGILRALVKYDGYDSDENEELDLKFIKKRRRRRRQHGSKDEVPAGTDSQSSSSSSTMFSPLSGTERAQNMSIKYSREEYEDDFEGLSIISERLKKRSSQQKQPTRKKAKSVVASGGQEKGTQKCSSTVTEVIRSSPIIEVSQALSRGKDVTDSNTPSQLNKSGFELEGFDDNDMEKPRFSHVPSHLKVPLVLDDSPLIQVPATMNQYLRDYQREGVKFLYSHYRENHGAILGDDMGLGKTVQVIAFIAALLRKSGTREDVLRMKPKFIRELSDTTKRFDDASVPAFLIVCPGSVLYNWADELETWGYFRYGCYHLTAKEKTLADVKKGKLEVVLTTFDTFRENFEDLDTYSWNAVVVDEAHKIKGLRAQVTEALRSIRTKRRYGLTGTALQNNMTELWAILDWANPNCLGSYSSFSFHYIKKIERGQKQDATKRELAEARKAKEKFSILRAKWMIRRTKALLVDQIPRKDDQVVYCKLPEFQAIVYEAILDHEDVKLILEKHKPCPCGSGDSRGTCCYKKNKHGYSMRSLTFSYMHLLLKAANHVALLIPEKTTSERQQLAAEEICEVAFEKFPEFVNQAREASFRTLSDPKYCGKMKVLQGMLSVFRKERSKVLLFSYSTKLLDILEQYVLSKGYEFRRLDGKVNEKRRHEYVREFNKDPDIFLFLISTKAGSLGLNLTGANVVVIFDPNWNPTHDLQAQDRAYRIGQRRDVRVFRLISTGTIEENMYLRQIYKQQLDNVAVATENARRYFVAVQGDKKQKGELFGIENMFSMRLGETCLTEDILERNKRIETALGGLQVSDYVPVEDVAKAKNAEADDRAGSDDEISLTPESDLDMEGLENEAEGDAIDAAVDCVDGGSEKLTQFTPQVAAEDDDGDVMFTELSDEENTQDDDANILDSLFDLFEIRKSKPRKRKGNRENEERNMGVSSSDNFPEMSPVGKEKGEFGATLKGKEAHLTKKRKEPEKFSFMPKKAKNEVKLKKTNDDIMDFDALVKEFDDAVENAKNGAISPHVKKKGVKRGVKFDVKVDSEPKPSTSGVTPAKSRKRMQMVESDDESLSLESEPMQAKAGKFTRIKTSPNEEQLASEKNARDVGKGKGVGKKSKSHIGAKCEVKGKQHEVSEETRVHLKKGISASDMEGSFSSISDVFNRCGVVHIHENKKVVGASKAEDHMSRCAMKDVFEFKQFSQMQAIECDPIVESEKEESPEPEPKKKKPSKQSSKQQTKSVMTPVQTITVGNKKVFVGQTPKAIQRLHFSRMAKHYNLSEIDFARRVTNSSPLEQQRLLRDFYTHEDSDLKEVIKDPEEVVVNIPEDIPAPKTVKTERKAQSRPKPAVRRKKTVPSRGRGCVYDDSSCDSSKDVSAGDKAGIERLQSKTCKRNDETEEKWNAFQEAYSDFVGCEETDSNGSNRNLQRSENSDEDKAVEMSRNYKRRRRKKLACIPSDGEEDNVVASGSSSAATCNSKTAPSNIVSSDKSNNPKMAAPALQDKKPNGTRVPDTGSFLDDLFSAPAKRKAPPKKKPSDRLPESSSIFDLF